jgi:S-adenosylmethionine:tRNA ribosyltransferase-isomerase
MNRQSGALEHKIFWDLPDFLLKDDLLVMNDTRVIPARIFAKKIPDGGKVELLLLKKQSELVWEALVGGKGLVKGKQVLTTDGLKASISEVLDGSKRVIEFSEPVESHLKKIGNVPLPPYIHETLADPERYQTIYSRQPGSAAAPTAGLHFSPELLARIKDLGVRLAYVDLHVGLDTFAPVTEEKADEHHIHTEWCELSQATADLINITRSNGGRVIAVGTTSVRTLESVASTFINGKIAPFQGPTSLFILPGYQFRIVDAMITNFHLPKSTLLMLVSAFAGREHILSAYQTAIKLKYRFFSFGDAMFIQ